MQLTEREKLELSRLLIKTNALKFGIFKLTSGKMSPYYIDLRMIPSFPDAFKKVVSLYKQIINSQVPDFKRIAGVPTAGIPFSSVVAYELQKPFIYTRKEAKQHGRERLVEGYLTPGDKILVIDDLATTGKSSREAVEAIRKEGGIVTDLVVLIDRLEGAQENMQEIEVTLHSVISIAEVTEELYNSGVINNEQYNQIVRQHASSV